MENLRAAAGLRNIIYVLGTLALYPLGLLLAVTQPHDPQGAMGIGGGLLALWFLSALVFVMVNVAMLILDLRKGRPTRKSGIGIGLPFILSILVLAAVG